MKLKSIFTTTATAVALVATLASCNSESTNENHTLSFNRGNIVAYADQQVDSFRVYYNDAWTLNQPSDNSWVNIAYNGQTPPITITPSNANFINVSDRVNVAMQPNNTGKDRISTINIESSYGKLGTLTLNVYQRSYLNVADLTQNNGKFVMNNVSADGYVVGLTNQVKPTLCFTVYSADATLTSSADWLKVPEKTTLPGVPTYVPNELQKVELTVEKNTTAESRTATLTLTSNGVSSTIEVTQLNK